LRRGGRQERTRDLGDAQPRRLAANTTSINGDLQPRCDPSPTQVRPTLANPVELPSGKRRLTIEERACGLHPGPSSRSSYEDRLETRSLSFLARDRGAKCRSTVDLSGKSLEQFSGRALTYVPWHTWTPRFAKRSFRCGIMGRDCSHTSGLCMRHRVAGPDGISWSAPDHFSGLVKSRAKLRFCRPRSYL
jgi:hypothetical protein